ncbi:MAG: iron-containing alcohol dehydrogenase [Ruminococcaceae bacterium]|nr:iron-containing alcohol dehydrogenase [Oscillospiraceae bacterium]
MERFCCTTQVVAGDGALAALRDMGIGRLLVVTDPYFMKNGTAERIAGLSGAPQVAYFDEVTPDPSVELVARGTSQVKTFEPDTILALGGGSAMDCAKAMGYFSGVPVVAVPTTSGSGSEVTDFAILTHDRVKHPLVDEKLRPKAAILDPALLESLPESLIADAGFDVLSHALEAYVAKNAGAITDALARDAFCTAFGALPASFGGNRSVRGRIHTAATMAGIAFNQAGLGLCHAMSHSLGGLFHVPHGRLNAILLPEVITCNGYTVAEKYARLARSAGLGGAADTLALRNLKNALIRLRRELKLPATLAQAGIDPAQVRRNRAQIVEAALKDPCCTTNPITVEPFMVHRILEEVTGRV